MAGELEAERDIDRRVNWIRQLIRRQYQKRIPPAQIVILGADAANVMRQALAGMLWSKQFYFFDGDNWLDEHNSNPLHSGYRSLRNSECSIKTSSRCPANGITPGTRLEIWPSTRAPGGRSAGCIATRQGRRPPGRASCCPPVPQMLRKPPIALEFWPCCESEIQ